MLEYCTYCFLCGPCICLFAFTSISSLFEIRLWLSLCLMRITRLFVGLRRLYFGVCVFIVCKNALYIFVWFLYLNQKRQKNSQQQSALTRSLMCVYPYAHFSLQFSLGDSSQFGLILLRDSETIIIITSLSWGPITRQICYLTRSASHRFDVNERARCANAFTNSLARLALICVRLCMCKSRNSMVIITNYIMQKGENENENNIYPHGTLTA